MRLRHKKNLESRWEQTADIRADEPERHRGLWLSACRPGGSGVVAELGCGRGGFSCDLAQREPQLLVVAIEKLRDAMIVGMEQAQKLSLPNIRFVAGDVSRLDTWFAPGELDGLYIHFCDPWPSRRHESRRLMAGGFLDGYKPLLSKDACLRFKTDNVPLFDFALGELQNRGWTTLDVHRDLPRSAENIETEYEKKFRQMGIPICGLTARP